MAVQTESERFAEKATSQIIDIMRRNRIDISKNIYTQIWNAICKSTADAERAGKAELPYTVQRIRKQGGSVTRSTIAAFATEQEAMKHAIVLESRGIDDRYEVRAVQQPVTMPIIRTTNKNLNKKPLTPEKREVR